MRRPGATDVLDLLSLAVGLALPWALGIALVATAYGAQRNQPIPSAWIVGSGWLAGMFVLTLVMRAVSAAGVTFSVASVGLPTLVLLVVALLAARRTAAAPLGTMLRNVARAFWGGGLDGWPRLVWRLVVAWLALRFALLLLEVWWLPLYPWDAWTQWATKARVWFELRTMAPFVGVGEWLGGSEPNAYMDAAPHYPATVPLFQVWSALLIGRWDDALVNLPWWLCGVAFAAGLYGGLVRLGFAPLAALGGSALVLTLPILNVHIALAGYADLPTAAYLTLGALAAVSAARTPRAGDVVVAALLLVACAMVKNPGKAWLVIVAAGVLVAAWPRRGLQFAAAAFAAAILGILALSRTGIRILGYQLSQDVNMPWGALFDAYFSFGNWHLLWYCAVATAVVGWRVLLAREVAPFTAIVAGGVMFLLVGFAFTNAGIWVEDQSTVNRATLHLAPLIVVWMLVTLRAWHAAHAASAPEPEGRAA